MFTRAHASPVMQSSALSALLPLPEQVSLHGEACALFIHGHSHVSKISSAHASTSAARSVQSWMRVATLALAQAISGFESVCLFMTQVSFFCPKKAPLAAPND